LEPIWKDWDPSILAAPNQTKKPQKAALPDGATSS
jgi:hypothetical protein